MKAISRNVPEFVILPVSSNILNTEREIGLRHTAFKDEYLLFRCIQEGMVEKLKQKMTVYFSQGMVMGRMSGNSLRQLQYWAVSSIAVAVHYAILGGLDETDAFNISDDVIRQVDACTEGEEIFALIQKKAVELCKHVRASKPCFCDGYSPCVSKCLHIIHVELGNPLPVDLLAEECGVSREYLSRCFKKEMGMTVKNYIMQEKLKASLLMLEDGVPYSEISYCMGFCSETHFITCFKKYFGVTPGRYPRVMPSPDSSLNPP